MELGDRHKTSEKSTEAEKENDKIELVITDTVVESINRILKQVSSDSSGASIYRIPDPLRNIKPEAYTPTLISIGPFHSGRKDLMANTYKPLYLQGFLQLTKLTTDTLIERVKTLEEEARNCYAEPIEMNKDEFVQLLVLDGCFVVMYLIGSQLPPDLLSSKTPNLWKLWFEIMCDMLLLENQLPFFLVQSLYDLCVSSASLKGFSFIQLACSNFINIYEDESNFIGKNVSANIGEVNHFIDLLGMHFTHTCSSECSGSRLFQRTFWPPSATELHQCGVFFRTEEKKKKCAVDIVFKEQSGCLELPQIIIDEGFETLVRNLIAYEQCQGSGKNKYEVSNFAIFMQCLVQTNQDVRLLIEAGIIQNNLGSINEITQLFNSLCKHISVLGPNFYNSECKKMKEYCKRRRHKWMTSLKRNYFSSPWACASSIAAILLLALTLVQTIMSVIKN